MNKTTPEIEDLKHAAIVYAYSLQTVYSSRQERQIHVDDAIMRLIHAANSIPKPPIHTTLQDSEK